MNTDWRTNIKKAVTRKGLSLRSVSIGIGKDEGYLKRALRRDGPVPSVETIIDVAEFIDEPVSSLIDGIPMPQAAREFIAGFAALTAEQQTAIMQMLAVFSNTRNS